MNLILSLINNYKWQIIPFVAGFALAFLFFKPSYIEKKAETVTDKNVKAEIETGTVTERFNNEGKVTERIVEKKVEKIVTVEKVVEKLVYREPIKFRQAFIGVETIGITGQFGPSLSIEAFKNIELGLFIPLEKDNFNPDWARITGKAGFRFDLPF